jgi:hypothetical protein
VLPKYTDYHRRLSHQNSWATSVLDVFPVINERLRQGRKERDEQDRQVKSQRIKTKYQHGKCSGSEIYCKPKITFSATTAARVQLRPITRPLVRHGTLSIIVVVFPTLKRVKEGLKGGNPTNHMLGKVQTSQSRSRWPQHGPESILEDMFRYLGEALTSYEAPKVFKSSFIHHLAPLSQVSRIASQISHVVPTTEVYMCNKGAGRKNSHLGNWLSSKFLFLLKIKRF